MNPQRRGPVGQNLGHWQQSRLKLRNDRNNSNKGGIEQDAICLGRYFTDEGLMATARPVLLTVVLVTWSGSAMMAILDGSGPVRPFVAG